MSIIFFPTLSAPLAGARAAMGRYCRLGSAVALAGLATTASATDYVANVLVTGNATHNDNLRMTEDDKTATYRYQVTPIVVLNANTELSKFALRSAFYFNQYDKSEFNSNDQSVALDYSREFTNSQIGLTADLQRSSTVTSELLDSGLIGDTAERTERYMASPYWTYTLNETNMLQLKGTYTLQDYKSTGYTGSKTASGGVDWIHVLDERLKAVLSLTYGETHYDKNEFDVPGGNIITNEIQFNPATGRFERVVIPRGYFGQQSYENQTQDTGVQIGLDYQWTEQTLWQARIGSTRSKTKYLIDDPQNLCAVPELASLSVVCPLEDSSDTPFTAQLTWSWQGERHDLSANIVKQTQPSSNGYTVDATQLVGSWGFKVTELDLLTFDLTLVKNRTIDDQEFVRNSAIGNRDYQTATLMYRRQFSENWFADASYQYNRQKYTDIDYQADSQVVSLGIRYQPKEWHWAR